MKQVEVKKEELDWIKSKLKDVHFSITKHNLDLNSYLKNYEPLFDTINSSIDSDKEENFVSCNLLRKLFYDTKDDPSAIFRMGFIDACYRFITGGEFNRGSYINNLAEIESQNKLRKIARREVGRIFLYGLVFAFLFIISLVQFELIDWRTLPWIFSTPPHHTLWECEYPDGTKVYNRVRNYRTYEEVQIYFDSRYRGDKKAGDCNAYRLDESLNHVAVCYDTIESIKQFERIHGFPKSIKVIDF